MAQEEEEAQAKSQPGRPAKVRPAAISKQLQQTKGRGNPLPRLIQAEMSKAFGKNFRAVRIHTDQNAVQMSKRLKAQAFTHGKDIYFNQGKFDPESRNGKQLLAHELTHVVQQSKKN